MAVVDAINTRMGRDTIRFARQGYQARGAQRSGSKTPAYTTRWGELAIVKAC